MGGDHGQEGDHAGIPLRHDHRDRALSRRRPRGGGRRCSGQGGRGHQEHPGHQGSPFHGSGRIRAGPDRDSGRLRSGRADGRGQARGGWYLHLSRRDGTAGDLQADHAQERSESADSRQPERTGDERARRPHTRRGDPAARHLLCGNHGGETLRDRRGDFRGHLASIQPHARPGGPGHPCLVARSPRRSHPFGGRGHPAADQGSGLHRCGVRRHRARHPPGRHPGDARRHRHRPRRVCRGGELFVLRRRAEFRHQRDVVGRARERAGGRTDGEKPMWPSGRRPCREACG